MTEQTQDPTTTEDDYDLEAGEGDPTAPDPGDLVEIDLDHQGDETDPPRDADDIDDPLDDIPDGDVVDADKLND